MPVAVIEHWKALCKTFDNFHQTGHSNTIFSPGGRYDGQTWARPARN